MTIDRNTEIRTTKLDVLYFFNKNQNISNYDIPRPQILIEYLTAYHREEAQFFRGPDTNCKR